MTPDLPQNQLVDLLRRMLVIRRFEEALIKLAGEFDIGPAWMLQRRLAALEAASIN